MTTETAGMTDAQRVELQRKCVTEHIRLENAHDLDGALRDTFVTDDSAFYDVAPGLAHFEGLEGVRDFYDMLFGTLPDISIKVLHEYTVPGCTVIEGLVTGTHSQDFAGVPASGNFVSFPFAAMYLFADDPTRLIAERAYWDNDGVIRQMRGEDTAVTDLPW